MAVNKRAKRKAKQLFQLCLRNDSVDEPRVRQVVQQAVASGHRGCSTILAYLLRLVRLHHAQHTAHIESATVLPVDLRAAIQATLSQRYGPRLTIAFAQRPSLIGGIRIQVGSDLLDGSVLAGLAALEKGF
jgi:F-type H+-transporting ATPase subunit delta